MKPEDQAKLAEYIAKEYFDDPNGYFRAVLQVNPDPWQEEVNNSVRDNRRTAVGACHGPGKTFNAAGIIHWWMATRPYPRVRCTANTEKQIMSVLWSELAKVHRRAINKDMFQWTKTGFVLKSAPEIWWAQAIAWSENNSEAFAGIHEKYVLYIFDEASAIPDIIWEVSQGAMTNPHARWLVLGNRTRNKGRFHECFGKNKRRDNEEDTSKWNAFTVSAFDSPRVSQDYINEIEREYGKDSDPYRVRVLGLPPTREDQQFIPIDLFEKALHTPPVVYPSDMRILSCDPARFGDDRTVIGFRKGNSAGVIKSTRGQDIMKTAGDMFHEIARAKEAGEEYDSVVVDVVGIGAGIVDRLREQGVKVIEVNFGSKPMDGKCKNLGSELWKRMREWLETGSVTEEFRDDLIGRQYYFDSSDRLVMERKEDMKRRGLASPDIADMLAMTFVVRHINRLDNEPVEEYSSDTFYGAFR